MSTQTINAESIESAEDFGRARIFIWGEQAANPRRVAENSGIQSLLDLNGEEVIFRRNVLKVLINRFKIAPSVPQGSIDNNASDGSTIVLVQIDGSTPIAKPKRGEIIIDGKLATHTADKIRHLGYGWELSCTVEEPG